MTISCKRSSENREPYNCDRLYECKICDKKFETYQGLGGHQTCHKRSRPGLDGDDAPKQYPCKICGELFLIAQALGGHMTKHKNDKDFEKGLVSAAAEKEGIRVREREFISTAERRHQCKLCGEEFSAGQALGGHMTKHKEEFKEFGADNVVDMTGWLTLEFGGRSLKEKQGAESMSSIMVAAEEIHLPMEEEEEEDNDDMPRSDLILAAKDFSLAL